MATASQVSTYASLDIGSHTIRLLIVKLADKKSLIPLRVERRITRLAKNFRRGDTLAKASIEKSILVLREYAKLLDQHQVQSLVCGATGVIRRAENRNDFLGAIRDSTGIECSIISEESEALLSTKGVLSVLPGARGSILSFDLGGSSTEFALSEANQPQPIWSTSVFTGAATVTEAYLSDEDPPETASVDRAKAAVHKDLEPVMSAIEDLMSASHISHFTAVGTAGTVTTLAAMFLKMTDYEPYRVNGLVLSRSWLTEIIDLLVRLPVAARQEITGLEKGREDIILGGALIVQEILSGLKLEHLTVTDGGLLEGMLLDLVERENGWPHALATPLTWHKKKG